MKKTLLLILFLFVILAKSQTSSIQDGYKFKKSYTFVAMNRELITIPNESKTTIVFIFNTWLPSCRRFYNRKILDTLAMFYDKEFSVVMIEGDTTTTDDDVSGVRGGNTLGDWTTTRASIVNDFKKEYCEELEFWLIPTMYAITKDGVVYDISPSKKSIWNMKDFFKIYDETKIKPK